MSQRDFMAIYCPNMPIQALLRAEEEYKGKKVAIVEAKGNRAVIICVSKSAEIAGIKPNMTPSQASAISSDICFREVKDCVIHSAKQVLLEVSQRFSPIIELIGIDTVVLEIKNAKADHLRNIGFSIQTMCKQMGLDVRVGIASGPRIAVIAGKTSDGITVVPKGNEAQFLALLPISVLSPSPFILEILTKLGVATVGDFAKMRRSGVGIRLGMEGLDLHRLASGEDLTHINPIKPEESIEESVVLEYSIEHFDHLIFLIAGAVERIVKRVVMDSRAISKIDLSLFLETKEKHILTSSFVIPTIDTMAIISSIRSSLEKDPPTKPIVGFTMSVSKEDLRAIQGDLFSPAIITPSKLGSLLTRLEEIVGREHVGCLEVSDSWAREKSAMNKFNPMSNINEVRTGKVLCLHLRCFRPPIEIEVDIKDGIVNKIKGMGVEGKIVRIAGPWYVDWGWWNGERGGAFYDVEILGIGIFRLWHDFVSNKWYLDGVCD